MPKTVIGAKLKKGESCFHTNGELLCLKWCDKHQVTVLTTIDDAVEVAWKHVHHGNVRDHTDKQTKQAKPDIHASLSKRKTNLNSNNNGLHNPG